MSVCKKCGGSGNKISKLGNPLMLTSCPACNGTGAVDSVVLTLDDEITKAVYGDLNKNFETIGIDLAIKWIIPNIKTIISNRLVADRIEQKEKILAIDFERLLEILLHISDSVLNNRINDISTDVKFLYDRIAEVIKAIKAV